MQILARGRRGVAFDTLGTLLTRISGLSSPPIRRGRDRMPAKLVGEIRVGCEQSNLSFWIRCPNRRSDAPRCPMPIVLSLDVIEAARRVLDKESYKSLRISGEALEYAQTNLLRNQTTRLSRPMPRSNNVAGSGVVISRLIGSTELVL